MKFPKLKNALLCRILVYVVVLGGFFVPMLVILSSPHIPDFVKVVVSISIMIGFIFYIFRNFVELMTLDLMLALLHCYNKARKSFVLPQSFSAQTVEQNIMRFGQACDPQSAFPAPNAVRYKRSTSWTTFSSGIEKVIAAYHIDYLDKKQYGVITHSANNLSQRLIGTKKPFFLDSSQRNAPLHRVTVIVIFANKIDAAFRETLFDTVCKNNGDGFDIAILPCVLDLEKQTCIFDSLPMPYIGFQYPVKNRGIKLIRKCVFNNRFPYKISSDTLDAPKDYDPNQSLWSFWKTMKKESAFSDRAIKKRFESMEHGEIIFEDGYIYLKWNEHGIWLATELNEETGTAEIDSFDSWDYPKSNKIAKNTIQEIKNAINNYFAVLGYTTKYLTYD